LVSAADKYIKKEIDNINNIYLYGMYVARTSSARVILCFF